MDFDKALQILKKLIKESEGCSLVAYCCPAGVWTIGYGNTFYEDGRPVRKGDKITQARAEELLDRLASYFLKETDKLVTADVDEGYMAAVADFAFNVGLDIDADTKPEGLGDSTLLKLINANPKDPKIFAYKVGSDGIAATGSCELLKWVNKGSKFEKGLRKRRQKEADLMRGKA